VRVTEIIPQHEYSEVIRQNKERKLWRENDTLSRILSMFMTEYAELVEAIETTPDIAYLIASEIGDLFYLAVKYENLQNSELPEGMQKVLEYALEICALTGLDPVDCLMMKILRNEVKYFAPIVNNGFNAQEAVAISKQFYVSLVGGEERFSHWYEEFGEILQHEK